MSVRVVLSGGQTYVVMESVEQVKNAITSGLAFQDFTLAVGHHPTVTISPRYIAAFWEA